MERLQKLLAQAGLGSRRACEAFITAGRVTVDGQTAHLGQRVSLSESRIEIDGKALNPPQRHVYLMLHKPPGVVTSARDPQGRPTVLDLVGPLPQRVYPVGRLDYDSEGLVLLTNDGPLAHRLLHPSHHVDRIYLVDVSPRLTASACRRLRSGIVLEDGPTTPCQVEQVAHWPQGVRLRMTMHEGRNRQIRRMVAAVDGRVDRLVRIAMGPLSLGDLASGQCRPLTEAEVAGMATSCQ